MSAVAQIVDYMQKQVDAKRSESGQHFNEGNMSLATSAMIEMATIATLRMDIKEGKYRG